MLNLLLDFLPFQKGGGVGGAASFTKTITDEVLRQCGDTTKLFAIYDSTLPVGRQYDYMEMAERNQITLLDIASKPLAELIRQHAIDTFFIAIGQQYAGYDLTGISCRTIMFIHDIFDVESSDNRIDLAITDQHGESRWQRFKRITNLLTGRWEKRKQRVYGRIMPLFTAPNTLAYTVSDYTANALKYYFPDIAKDIHVCYSPLKENSRLAEVENPQLATLINSGKPYLLMIAANRVYKNAAILTKVFRRLQAEHPELHLLTLKYGKRISDRHIDISYLSDSDLEHAYKHAHALVFGSFFEGFGYPPIEAARYSTPTVASNVTSIPEILGDAGIYFSPFYPAGLYQALNQVLADRNCRADAISRRYQEICERQQRDLNELVSIILNKSE